MKQQRRITLLVALFMVVMVLASPITAHADSIYIESQDITVELKEMPSKTVVVDKRGVLSDEQIQQIETAGTKLKIYDIGLYVEMTEEATCSQEYANTLAEQKYDELMSGKENSIMIVFSFYEDAGGYYAVHYDVQGDLSETLVTQKIEGTYHQFKTDATWIAGSFEQVVDYLTEVEDNLIHADEIAARQEERNILLLKIFRIMFELLAVATIIYLFWKLNDTEKECNETVNQKDKKIDMFYKEACKKKAQCNGLKKTCKNLQNWKEAAIASTPSVEKNVSEYFAKKCAREFNKKFENAKEFKELITMVSEYDEMSGEEKSFVELDVDKARAEMEKIAKVEAEKATKVISDACKKEGTRHNRDKLEHTMNYYNGLPSCVRILIAVQLIKKLNAKCSSAENDYRSYKNSLNSYNNSSNRFNHSGGFQSGTFGGGFHGGH